MKVIFAIKKIVPLGIMLFWGNTALAQGFVSCGGSEDPCQLCDIFVMLDKIFDFIFIDIIPPVAVLVFVIGGAYLLLNNGNPQTANKAKSILTAAVIGLVIIYGSWLLINLFFASIGVNEWTGLGNWFEYPCQ
ncbi:MAG: hypothetical protein ABH831_01920 [Candidatus Nealsonbacteria bacterium]